MAKQKNAKKNKKVAIYIRVSTVEQSENDFSSLDGQKNQCKACISNRNKLEDQYYDFFKSTRTQVLI